MRSKTVYVCGNCGAEFSKWMGKCSSCSEWNTLMERQVAESVVKASKQILSVPGEVVALKDIKVDDSLRLSTAFAELDTALGGGLVEEQVLLLAGEPGIGKSTLLLQACIELGSAGVGCLYASGEESPQQVARRASRLYPGRDVGGVEFVSAPGVHGLLEQIRERKPKLVVVDSIQTAYDESLNSLPGSLAQVKSCTSLLVRAAKSEGFMLLLVGHINKEGTIAGPKTLEHMVDTVLQFEGERDGDYRIVRALKNRFGSTGEVGLFVMAEHGLRDMRPEDNVFGGGDEDSVGAAKTLVIEGNRPIIVQVQALCNPTVFAYPKRVAEGLSISRLQLICAILDRFAGAKLGDKDVYVRTTGGYHLNGVQSDLAVAAAILSSATERAVPGDTLFIGELSLSGRVGASKGLSDKMSRLDKLGVERLVGNLNLSQKKPLITALSMLSQLSALLK